ncbi:outer membrane protein [Archangium gephyra]|uniref:Outer membrane protein n=1 Tax=Archangium gephyra TaxID=48 RepID=A0AAC8QH00_9BACT|nr:TolC family protein [Archangium gephyra]AKJ07315.1 Outer membrane protein [Archangium gephyra]REG26719.1 outer membrane protein [Archangium gephyra]
MRTLLPLLTLLLAASPAWAQQRVLTLDEALRTAAERQPQLRQAQANTTAANARVDQNFSSLLPQVSANLTYQRSLSENGTVNTTTPSGFISREGFNVGASVSQLLWDFGRTTGRWRSAQQSAQAQKQTENQTSLDVLANVQTAYFNALAQQALVQVAQETLDNEKARLGQVNAQVQVGTRPEIDLLQQRTAVANAQVQLIQARNNAATSRAQLNQAMGLEGSTDYTVQDAVVAPVEGEALAVDALVDTALQGRPELAASEYQLRAQELQISATRGGYWPRLSASVSGSQAGADPTKLQWGLNGQVGLSWPLFEGGITRAQVREQEANLTNLQAQRDALRQQVRLEVERAQLAVNAASESVSATEEALANARERLRLAEGRYRAGVGNIIELSDAQLSATNAAVQRVQATYNLATARTELARALGRQPGPTG